jgi:hypothetical protein
MYDIEREEKHLKESNVGHPIVGGNLAQGVIVEKFPDILFDGGSFGIESPDPPGMGL